MPIQTLPLPCADTDIRSLRVGDRVVLTGILYTARDRVHKFLAEGGESPVPLRNGGIFHCGPVVMEGERPREPFNWRVTAAGPTTSIREEPYMAEIIAEHGIRVIAGKGGMGEATREACRLYGCVYVQLVGGAAALLAQGIRNVRGVHFLDEFGPTEALWELELGAIDGIVGMDAYGRSLYEDVRESSRRSLELVIND